jgi:hypothetical protein
MVLKVMGRSIIEINLPLEAVSKLSIYNDSDYKSSG